MVDVLNTKIKKRGFVTAVHIRKGLSLSAKTVADAMNITPATLSRVEQLKTDASITVAYRNATALGLRLDDMMNMDNINVPLIEHRPFVRLPYIIKDEQLIAQIAQINSEEMLKEYYASSAFPSERAKLMLSCTQVIGEYEVEAVGYEEAWAEYAPVIALPKQLKEVGVPEEKEEWRLGDAYAAVRSVRQVASRTIAMRAGVSPSLIVKMESNVSDLSARNFDAIARALGLTADELIFVAHPPKHRWPLFLPQGTYSNQQMVASTFEICRNFNQITLEERAEAMVAFKDWLSAEYWAKIGIKTGNNELITAPNTFSLTKLWSKPSLKSIRVAS